MYLRGHDSPTNVRWWIMNERGLAKPLPLPTAAVAHRYCVSSRDAVIYQATSSYYLVFSVATFVGISPPSGLMSASYSYRLSRKLEDLRFTDLLDNSTNKFEAGIVMTLAPPSRPCLSYLSLDSMS